MVTKILSVTGLSTALIPDPELLIFSLDLKDGYPLKIEAKKVDIVKTEFNQEFIKGILTKIDYDALRNAVSQTKRKLRWR